MIRQQRLGDEPQRTVLVRFAERKILSNAGLPVPVVAVGKLGYPDLAEAALRSGIHGKCIELARDAAPFYLKLSESVLLQQPGHRALAEAVAGGFTRYAYAFIASEAERIEAHDSKQAEALRQRAQRPVVLRYRTAAADRQQS